jgi:hypothetical protein
MNQVDLLNNAITSFIDKMGHDGCTPNGGCPIAELCEEQRKINAQFAETAPAQSRNDTLRKLSLWCDTH